MNTPKIYSPGVQDIKIKVNIQLVARTLHSRMRVQCVLMKQIIETRIPSTASHPFAFRMHSGFLQIER